MFIQMLNLYQKTKKKRKFIKSLEKRDIKDPYPHHDHDEI